MIDTQKYTLEEGQKMFLEHQRKIDALCFTTSGKLESKIDKERAFLDQTIEDLLNERVNLYKYVKKEKVTQILIVYLIFDLEEDEKYNLKSRYEPPYYSSKTKLLDTSPLMTKDEYKQYISCSTADALKILCKKTLEGIIALKKYEKRLKLDWRGLNAELEKLFEEKMGYNNSQ